jgi:hypothetical protein
LILGSRGREEDAEEEREIKSRHDLNIAGASSRYESLWLIALGELDNNTETPF